MALAVIRVCTGDDKETGREGKRGRRHILSALTAALNREGRCGAEKKMTAFCMCVWRLVWWRGDQPRGVRSRRNHYKVVKLMGVIYSSLSKV